MVGKWAQPTSFFHGLYKVLEDIVIDNLTGGFEVYGSEIHTHTGTQTT